MAGVDVAKVAKEKKKKEAAKKLENRKRKQEAERERLLEKVPYPRSGLSSSSTTSSEDEDGDFKAPATKLPGEDQQTSCPKYRANVGLGPRRAVRASGLELLHGRQRRTWATMSVTFCHFAEHCPTFKDQEQGDLAIKLEREAFKDPPPLVPTRGKTNTESDFEMGFQRTALPWFGDRAKLRGDPGSPRRTRWNGTRSRKEGFSQEVDESVPGSRSLAFPFRYDGLEQRACSQAPVYKMEITSVAPCSGWHAGTKVLEVVLKHVFENAAALPWSRDPTFKRFQSTLGNP
ncbi:hypothetical protein GWK47_007370 [Chionoecetes opilio]|uniref:Uncharacterized protein n=1 Tax=Chionoecetes opilio TaxID=41210 RepID=A0A8J4YD56_CHIOP|nr:hypothetical protein GWK47_007370 [Chionoecetes opilio]